MSDVKVEQTSPVQPPKYKMAILTFLVLWPLVHFIPSIIMKYFVISPLLLEVLSIAIIVFLMTYVIMPVVTKLLREWLAPSNL